MLRDQCPSPSKPCCRGIWLGLPVKCSACWTLYCHLSSPSGLVPWSIHYELLGTLVHLCSWVCDVAFSRPAESISQRASLKVTICGPLSQIKPLPLPTSFSIFPSARTHSSSSQRFAMSDPGGHASHCTFLSLPAEIRRKIYKFVFEGNTVFVRPGKRITGTIKTTRSLEALYQLRYPRQFNCGVELGVHDVSGGAASMTESSASFARAARTGTSKASSFAGFGLRSFGGRV